MSSALCAAANGALNAIRSPTTSARLNIARSLDSLAPGEPAGTISLEITERNRSIARRAVDTHDSVDGSHGGRSRRRLLVLVNLERFRALPLPYFLACANPAPPARAWRGHTGRRGRNGDADGEVGGGGRGARDRLALQLAGCTGSVRSIALGPDAVEGKTLAGRRRRHAVRCSLYDRRRGRPSRAAPVKVLPRSSILRLVTRICTAPRQRGTPASTCGTSTTSARRDHDVTFSTASSSSRSKRPASSAVRTRGAIAAAASRVRASASSSHLDGSRHTWLALRPARSARPSSPSSMTRLSGCFYAQLWPGRDHLRLSP